MNLVEVFDIYDLIRFSKQMCECSAHIWSCPCQVHPYRKYIHPMGAPIQGHVTIFVVCLVRNWSRKLESAVFSNVA